MSSGSCCAPTCQCDDWLTSFCDYETVTHVYCGESTEFEKARRKAITQDLVRPEHGVYAADVTFEISESEQAVETGIGARITDADGTEWIVYRSLKVAAFCIHRLWARSVAHCFSLTDAVEVIEREDCGDTCDPKVKWNVVGKTRGKVLVESGASTGKNRADQIQVRYNGQLVRWPAGEYPTADQFLRTKKGVFRITSFRDGGEFVPFTLTLERTDDDCSSC